jgi:hypothetical protein
MTYEKQLCLVNINRFNNWLAYLLNGKPYRPGTALTAECEIAFRAEGDGMPSASKLITLLIVAPPAA